MGCCFSRPNGPNGPYPGAAQSSSAHAINSPTELSPAGNHQSHANRQQQDAPPAGPSRRHRRPLDQRINKPLRRHEWASKDKTWSRASIDRERVEFFDTRVSGRPEVWQTLKAALEVLWEADKVRTSPAAVPDDGENIDEHAPAVALATAQSILNAAEVLLPTGNLANGAYDSLGNYYQLPPQIVCDPINLAVTNDHDLGDSKDGLNASAEGPSGDADADLNGTERRKEKGRSVVDIRSQMLVAIRLSETSKDLKLRVGEDETVRSIIRKIIEETGHRPGYRVRLVYLGKILQDNASLEDQGWQAGQVINAFMFDPPS